LNAAGQVNQAITFLENHHLKFDRVWIDIESGAGWDSQSGAHAWIEEAVTTVNKRLGENRVGIYSSYYQWESVVGLSNGGFNHIPLWFADYDGVPDVSHNFKGFAGWSHANIKQYRGDVSFCGAGVDFNHGYVL